MHIGILSARSPKYHPNRRLAEAASREGHRVVLIHPKDCISHIQSGMPGVSRRQRGNSVDALLPRIGASINQYALTLVRHFEISGIPVINGFHSILLARNKFLSLQALAGKGVSVPVSYYVSNLKNLEKAVSKLGGYPVVVKTINSRQGKGVMIAESATTAKFIMDNLMDRRHGVLIQQYIPPDDRRDIRAFVLGKRVLAAMELKPTDGDFRSNIHLKSKARPLKLDKELRSLAVRAAAALGLEIAGTDIIVDARGTPMVLETNYSPGFRGLEAAADVDVAAGIIQYIVRTRGGVARCISHS